MGVSKAMAALELLRGFADYAQLDEDAVVDAESAIRAELERVAQGVEVWALYSYIAPPEAGPWYWSPLPARITQREVKRAILLLPPAATEGEAVFARQEQPDD